MTVGQRPGGFLDRARAERLMAAEGIDALVLMQPETIRYATGAFPGVASFWRRAGAALVLVPGDAGRPMGAVVGDLQEAGFRAESGLADVRTHRLWVETGVYDPGEGEDLAAALRRGQRAAGRPERVPRPGTFNPREAYGHLREMLHDRGLTRARLGLDLAFVPAADLPALRDMLPDVEVVDCTRLVERLRAIKAPAEAQRLRIAAELAGAGVAGLTAALRPGLDAAALTAIWRKGVEEEAGRRKLPPPASTWAYIAIGGDGFAPGDPAKPGDLVKIDVGCVIDGYSSDGGRTAVLGRPSAAQRGVFDALHRAFDAGLALLRPGAPLPAVHRAVMASMWDEGFSGYNRGHVGHGVGASIWSEEWPFIAADAGGALAEPGMMLAFETPFYIKGLGGFIIEDQIAVTEQGIEIVAPTPRDLIVVPA